MKFCAKCKGAVFLIIPLFLFSVTHGQSISGGLKKWHKITFSFNGPLVSETDSFNPFLNYRLNVTFTHSSGKTYKVPGYFAADGNAAETGASSGNKWRVHFAPDEIGLWTYVTSFRKGTNIAVSDKDSEGVSVKGVDSLTGAFAVAPTDKTGRDLRGKGKLSYVDSSLLQFAETKEYFRKAGADAPENFLAYADFDNTPDSGGRLKTWAPHIQDWQEGDPTWQGTKGKGIIGAINYLSSQGMNSFSFIPMNIKGDDKNVYPYISPSSLTRIDVSKVSQWEMVFEHADKMGMHLHFKTQEIENENLLDSGNTGIQRKLYYRELIARFSHHLALNWNLGEENTQTTQQQKDMAQYFYSHDPYKHNIVMHTLPGKQETEYRPLIGSASALTGISIQTDTANVYAETKKWVLASAAANKKWIVANDEQGSSIVGVAADSEYKGNRGSIPDNSNAIRKAVLWGNFMAGGAGVEYYFGYKTGETDLTCQDFRSRAKSWKYANYALDFFHTYLPRTILSPMTNISAGWIAGKDSSVYVIYLKSGGTANITLPLNTNYLVSWYNPRQGSVLQPGSVKSISGGGIKPIGNPPADSTSDSTSDWVVLLKQIIPPVISTTVYQAEDYTAQSGITISSENPGYTDTGYADYSGIGSFIEWNNVKKCNTLKFYYANGSIGSRQCAIIVNGILAGNIAFEKTNGWDIWQTASINVLLQDSLNIVTVIANTINGGPNIDKMEIVDSAIVTPSYRHSVLNPVLNVYPNPVHKNLNVLSAKGGLINIYNMQGIKVYSNAHAKKIQTVNTGNLSEGIYIVELISEGKKITKQFIKN